MTRACTFSANGRLHEIILEIGISEPFVSDQISHADSRIIKVNALWDTGATGSVITPSTAAKLGLAPSKQIEMYHAGGKDTVNAYLVNFYLPNNIVITNLTVSECKEDIVKFGAIVGMDIITMGDFSITNFQGKTVVSFRIPSMHCIDYVKEQKIEQIQKGKGFRQQPKGKR